MNPATTPIPARRPTRLLAGAAVLGIAAAACGGDAPASAAAGEGAVTAHEPWARPSMVRPGAGEGGAPVNGAAYLVLRNGSAEPDALVAVASAVADTVELHTVTMQDDIMRMRPVDSIPVPAGGEAVLRPGGYHVMLIGLREPLVEGDTVALTLRFRSGGVLEVPAPVRTRPPLSGTSPD